jgi:hypothetical protein
VVFLNYAYLPMRENVVVLPLPSAKQAPLIANLALA